MRKLRIGLMGLGYTGRQIYNLSLLDDRFDVVAISDIGQPEILCHLLNKSMGTSARVRLEDNCLVSENNRTRLLSADHPTEIPWDVFETDFVVDATGKFRSLEELRPHISNGAKRVICTSLPEDSADRVILFGINEDQMQTSDSIISAGSASTTAAALMLKLLNDHFEIRHASITSVHAYTSDQSLQDYAGADYRRSRSGAENIIPNSTPAVHWIQQVIPGLSDRVTGFALNVPVQLGSMLDLNVSISESDVPIEELQKHYIAAAEIRPNIIKTTSDPIVSSDVKYCPQSVLIDLLGCMKAGSHTHKIIGWHSTLGHAQRVIDIISGYNDLDEANKNEEAA